MKGKSYVVQQEPLYSVFVIGGAEVQTKCAATADKLAHLVNQGKLKLDNATLDAEGYGCNWRSLND